MNFNRLRHDNLILDISNGQGEQHFHVQCSERIVLHESASMSWATFESRERIMEYPPFVDVFYWNGSTFP